MALKPGDRRRLESIKRKGGERTGALLRGRTVLIYSNQWGAWWLPPANGYTRDRDKAGRYDFEEALDRSHHCGREKGIMYEIA